MYKVFYRTYDELAINTVSKIKFEYGFNNGYIPGLRLYPVNSKCVIYVYIPEEEWSAIIPLLKKAFAGEPIDLTKYAAVSSLENSAEIGSVDLSGFEKLIGKSLGSGAYRAVDKHAIADAINKMLTGSSTSTSDEFLEGASLIDNLLNK